MKNDETNQCIIIIVIVVCPINEYYESYMFRMSQLIFLDLLDELESQHGLHGFSRMIVGEVLALILYILSHNKSIISTMSDSSTPTKQLADIFLFILMLW